MTQHALTVLAVALVCYFALKWKREKTLGEIAGRFARETLDEFSRDAERRLRRSLVRAAVLGLVGVTSVVTGGLVANRYAAGFAEGVSPDVAVDETGAQLVYADLHGTDTWLVIVDGVDLGGVETIELEARKPDGSLLGELCSIDDEVREARDRNAPRESYLDGPPWGGEGSLCFFVVDVGADEAVYRLHIDGRSMELVT